MTTPAHFIVSGLKPEPLDAKKFPLREMPPGATCFITGEKMERGYYIWDIIPGTTCGLGDVIHSGGEWMSIDAARAWKASWNMGSRLIFEDGTHYHPLVDAKAAQKQGRAWWSSLIREVWPARQGQRLLCIVATDYKKRVWQHARIGVLGSSTSVFVYSQPRITKSGSDMCKSAMTSLIVNWPRLIETLDFVETVYTAGFTRAALRTTLLHSASTVKKIGLRETMIWERRLQPLRQTPEFHIAAIVAQKISNDTLTAR